MVSTEGEATLDVLWNYELLQLIEGKSTTEHISFSSEPMLEYTCQQSINPLNPELNSIYYLLALLGAHHFLHVSRIMVKSLTLRLLMSYYIYGAHILDISRSHTTTQHSR